MPWKNGGGTTTEIMIWPENADVGTGFEWRVSMADVATDGQFSAFPNYRRSLMVLAGNGLVLTTSGSPDISIGPGDDAIEFNGATPVSARLIDGPVRDFNVMCRNRNGPYIYGWLRAETLTRTTGLRLAADFELFYALRGKFTANGLTVDEGDTLVVTEGETMDLSATREAEVIVVTIWNDGIVDAET